MKHTLLHPDNKSPYIIKVQTVREINNLYIKPLILRRMKKELLSVSLLCCLLAFQHATPAKAQAAGQAGGNRQQT